MKAKLILLITCFFSLQIYAEDKNTFKIRGVLPWHNFMCGPSAWNERDYTIIREEEKDMPPTLNL